MSNSLSRELAQWVEQLGFSALPDDVIESTKLRVLDVIGLALAGAEMDFGRSVRNAALAMGAPGPCRILATGERAVITAAAFASGSFPQALEYDDTHVESIVHMSSPAVAAALAIAEIRQLSGRDFITAVAISNEISSRAGSVSSGELHKRGFHPTGLFAPFGVSYLAGKLLQLDSDLMTSAAGIVGSFASGVLECWVDGTQSKFLHSGWAAQSGVAAAFLARSGISGPEKVFEGRFGLFSSHVQDPAAHRDFRRINAGLGVEWESRHSSFKPFPAAHVIHPYISAAIELRKQHAIDPARIQKVECPVTSFIVPIVCEPAGEKFIPATEAHGRVSLQYSIAEALCCGKLGKSAYSSSMIRNPQVLALARKVHYYIDPDYPGPGRFKGAVKISLNDGTVLEKTEEYNRGSEQNPMSYAELRAKFDENAGGFLSRTARDRLAATIKEIESLGDASTLTSLAISDL